jgi:hypothetical protein
MEKKQNKTHEGQKEITPIIWQIWCWAKEPESQEEEDHHHHHHDHQHHSY